MVMVMAMAMAMGLLCVVFWCATCALRLVVWVEPMKLARVANKQTSDAIQYNTMQVQCKRIQVQVNERLG